ncbi:MULTISPECIES: hypothetical protein [Thermoflexus]|jgi:predicted membrane channel-forming protein YqfA (hemolysin III family)|uniref:hypothetical protein n=1 Tax=Thermoflexus TaxID=1495649 RepID=UPI001C776340|nr:MULTISPECIES: hypothetical protein [Thermoflexus]QWK11188.1 MAG: hypothetical protein KNN16_02660 [Thermoflexus hugenholtzii]
MPRLTRWFIRAALGHLLVALLLGALLGWGRVISLPPILTAATPVYFHLLMLGGVAQFIIGVAWWMFPPLSKERPRGNEALAWAVFFLLNGGLILRAICEPWVAVDPQPIARGGLFLSALALVAAGWIFVGLLWPRVKGR